MFFRTKRRRRNPSSNFQWPGSSSPDIIAQPYRRTEPTGRVIARTQRGLAQAFPHIEVNLRQAKNFTGDTYIRIGAEHAPLHFMLNLGHFDRQTGAIERYGRRMVRNGP